LQIIKQMEADSGAYKLVIKEGRNYVGFIAQGPADSAHDEHSKEVDLAVVFRGTITNDEWLQVRVAQLHCVSTTFGRWVNLWLVCSRGQQLIPASAVCSGSAACRHNRLE
jgi:hypothetical protein